MSNSENPNTKYAVVFTLEQMNYLLNVLEPLADKDKVLDKITDQFDESFELDDNLNFVPFP